MADRNRKDLAAPSQRAALSLDSLRDALEALEHRHLGGGSEFTEEERAAFAALSAKFHRLATLPGKPPPRLAVHGRPHGMDEAGGVAPHIPKE